MKVPATLTWHDGVLRLLDQRALPHRIDYLEPRDAEDVFDAIRTLAVRGAPAIGVAAAYGLTVAMRPHQHLAGAEFMHRVRATGAYLKTARPTAVNLAWAVTRMVAAAGRQPDYAGLCREAEAIHAEDQAMCMAIGEAGLPLIEAGVRVLTHCNAGALAVSGCGTATAPLYVAHEAGVPFSVFAGETRPLWQGARLTAWELSEAGIDVTLICDNMAATLMSVGDVDLAIVGADRVTRNGDVVNKIGTLNVAVLCRHFGVPFYVACPSSTFDASTATGADVEIEERAANEVLADHAAEVPVRNPAFDVTPQTLVTGYVTDKGLLDSAADLERLLGQRGSAPA